MPCAPNPRQLEFARYIHFKNAIPVTIDATKKITPMICRRASLNSASACEKELLRRFICLKSDSNEMILMPKEIHNIVLRNLVNDVGELLYSYFWLLKSAFGSVMF